MNAARQSAYLDRRDVSGRSDERPQPGASHTATVNS
jgi:hypothetical protein